MKKRISFIILSMLILLLTSCMSNSDAFSSKISGSFIYSTKGCKEGEADIIGLTDEGKNKDVLVFPEVVDGLCVRRLGTTVGYKTSEVIEITNAKKVYFPSSYLTSASGISFTGNSNVCIYSPDGDMFNTVYYAALANENARIVASTESINKLKQNNKDVSIVEEANVFYYSNDRVCYIDKVKGSISDIMPAPYNGGMRFVGWYQDKECSIELNKDTLIIEENIQVFLYAKWS